MEKAERTEKRKQAIRRALVRWFDQREAVAGDKTVKAGTAGAAADVVVMEVDGRKNAVRADGTTVAAGSGKRRMSTVHSDQTVWSVLIGRHTVFSKRGPPLRGWRISVVQRLPFTDFIFTLRQDKKIRTY